MSGITELIHHKQKISYSVVIFLFLGMIYTISVQLAYMKGLGASVKPFINIPAADYYYWQKFYQIPFFFVNSIIFAGTARLLAIPYGGKGQFEDLFCLCCVAQIFPMFLTMWLPETTYFVFFDEAAIFPVWVDSARQIIGTVWPFALMVLGVGIIERIRWYCSILVTLIAAIPVIALIVVFIR